jgi:murein DD-endopeptidase MepM/ murein hydrolase activator NlpD
MRWLLILIALPALAETFSIGTSDPSAAHGVVSARQGALLIVKSDTAERARLLEKTITLFPAANPDQAKLALMPVPTLTKPGDYKIEFLDKAGAVIHSEPLKVIDAHYTKQNITIEKAVAELKPSPGEQQKVGAFRDAVSPERHWDWPLKLSLPIPGCMTSPFGSQRLQNGKPTGDFHAGLDQRGTAGTPIKGIAAGTVKVAQQFNLRGGTVGVDHGQGLTSIYMHMSKVAAVEGSHVEQGDVIGYVGSTGRSTGPHLHWTLYAEGIPVNPRQWVTVSPCPPKSPPKK